MAKIYKGMLELVGNTPLVEAVNLERELGLSAKLLLKMEYFNPAGSVKDRVAKAMIEDAEEKGLLREGSVIIEPTSGNTGIGLASIASVKGYRLILTMPETMSVERRNILKAYGAEIVLTEGAKGMTGAIEKAEELAKEFPEAISRTVCKSRQPGSPQSFNRSGDLERYRGKDRYFRGRSRHRRNSDRRRRVFERKK